MSIDGLPTLEQLQDALIGNKTEQLQLLRNWLKWEGESTERVVPELTKDSAYNRLRILLDNFGPLCVLGKDEKGNTLVHLTAKTCETEAALEHIFISRGGELDIDSLDCFRAKGSDDKTPTHFAARNRSIVALKWLVRKLGSKCLNVKCGSGNTAVHIAANHQGAEFMQFIKHKLGASYFYKTGSEKRNAFHFAAMNLKSNEALKWLISDFGPDCLLSKDSLGHTPVHLAACRQGESFMVLLKESLGDQMFTLNGKNDELVVHSAAQNKFTSDTLAWCVREMGPECLLAKDSQDQLPIHLAARYQGERSMEMAVRALGQSCLTTRDGAKQTTVHYAAMNETGNSVLRWIVSQLGPDCLKLPDDEGVMPVHLAAWYQGVDSLSFIMDCLGPEAFELATQKKWTMAHYAADNYSRIELLQWIVREVGPQCLLVPDAYGSTAEEAAGLCE